MQLSRRRFLAMLTPALIAAGCGRLAFRSPEVLLFSTSGNRIFQDYIWIADPSSGSVRAFLRPAGRRSYLAASARSLRGPVAVVVHESMAAGGVGDAIDLYWPPQRWRRRWYQPPASPGIVALAPGGQLFAAGVRPTPQQGSHIWVFPVGGGEPTDVSNLLPGEDGSADFSPQWSPDGRQLMFRRLRALPALRSQTTELLSYAPASNQLSVMRARARGFLIACFGPHGSLIMRQGSVLKLVAADGTAQELLAADAISGALVSDVGLEYSERLNAVAFTMARDVTAESMTYEIWLLYLANRRLQRLFSTGDSRLIEIGFARP